MSALLSWWRTLAPREQRGLGLAAVVVLGALLYVGIEEPLSQRRAFLRQQIAATSAGLDAIERFAARAAALDGAHQRPPLRLPEGQSPIAFVNAAAAASGLDGALRRSVPQGETVVVTLAAIPFDALADWLVRLELEHGIGVARIALNRAEGSAGLVTGSVTLDFAR